MDLKFIRNLFQMETRLLVKYRGQESEDKIAVYVII